MSDNSNNNIKYMVIFGIVGLVIGLIVGKIAITIALTFVGAGLGGFLGGYLANMMNNKKSAKTEEPKEEPVTKNPVEVLLEELFSLNLKLRTKYGTPEDVTLAIEKILDKLISLIPQMNERFRGEELTWEVNRMGNYHINNLLENYLQMDKEEREANKGKILDSIKAIETDLQEVDELVKQAKLGDFERKAKSIKMKYGKGSI